MSSTENSPELNTEAAEPSDDIEVLGEGVPPGKKARHFWPTVGRIAGLFRGHRSGDTGEIAPVPDDVPAGAFASDPVDPEAARYAPRPPGRYAVPRRILQAAVLLGLAWVVLAAGWSWSQAQFYVADHDGNVAIFRGLNADLPGLSLSHAYEVTDVELSRLSDIDAEQVREGIEADDLDDARVTVDNYAARQDVDQAG